MSAMEELTLCVARVFTSVPTSMCFTLMTYVICYVQRFKIETKLTMELFITYFFVRFILLCEPGIIKWHYRLPPCVGLQSSLSLDLKHNPVVRIGRRSSLVNPSHF